MKVLMIPSLKEGGGNTSGISRVIEHWVKYLPEFDIEVVEKTEESDLKCVHAGLTGNECDVAHLHGMYFTGDYPASKWEFGANAHIVNALRSARAVTVPSEWVAEILRRDMHMQPYVIPHGIEADEWAHNFPNEGYVLWNKNRSGQDVCNADSITDLANAVPGIRFISTYAPKGVRNNNVSTIGIIPHIEMKVMVQKAGVYLSTTKETFGIGILEALAGGVPVLGWDYGGNSLLVDHLKTGYLAEPNNYEDLKNGLAFILDNRQKMSIMAIESVQKWKWRTAVEKLAHVYYDTLYEKTRKKTISVIIPVYNYANILPRAIESVINQTIPPNEIIVVDDGSQEQIKPICEHYPQVKYIHQNNSGVAEARNNGIRQSTGDYICCLDPDDYIENRFIETCYDFLERNLDYAIAYTGLAIEGKDGEKYLNAWPPQSDYSKQVTGDNQVPTCALFRREVFDRTGGYRSRYCPSGCGTEDANFWLRAGALGFQARKVTDGGLFVYSMDGNTHHGKGSEVNWFTLHPYTRDGIHPLASCAEPKFMSHPVFQYDEPLVSVIIPVGNGHEKTVIDAIESLEFQSFRRWECIVVWDSKIPPSEYLRNQFPFVRMFFTKKHGAGVARNLGVKQARSKFLLFLDADDWLHPDALEKMTEVGFSNKQIVYSDYAGICTLEEQYKQQMDFEHRVLAYNPKSNETTLLFNTADYDCGRAQRQPDRERKDIFHWCLVTCLVPLEYHNSIGGFDEKMKTWEDVDYHWRMSHKGYCYTRIPHPLIIYRFNTGTRRDMANAAHGGDRVEVARDMIQYMEGKYKEIKMSPCKSCGGAAKVHPEMQKTYEERMKQQEQFSTEDDNFKLCVYLHPNRGDHPVVGAGTQIRYGYKAHGDKFLVHVKDIAAQPSLYRIYEDTPIDDRIVNLIGYDNTKQLKEFGISTLEIAKEVGADAIFSAGVPREIINKLFGISIGIQ